MNPSTDRSRLLVCSLLLFVGTWLLFLPVVQHEFVNYDDDHYITHSDLVKQGLSLKSAASALVTPHFFMWHPVTTWSLQLDYSLFGLKPAGYHLTNLLFHSLSSILVLLLVWRMCRIIPVSLIIAALFAWHPLRVESVAWAAERKDVLSTFFWLAALHCYLSWHRQKSSRYQWLTYAATILAMMSKPIAVTIPATFFLLDFWPLRRLNLDSLQGAWSRNRKLFDEKIPFFILSILLALVTLSFQAQSKSIVSLDELPLIARVINAGSAYFSYLSKIILPLDLAVFYPPEQDIILFPALVSLVLFGFATRFTWQRRQEKPYLLFGLLWFLVTLLPVIGLLQSGRQSMADRYSYISSLGITISLLLFAWEKLSTRISHRHIGLIASLAIGFYAYLTHAQLEYWQNSETLFRHALNVTRNNYIAHINLGAALAEKGNLAEALPHYEAALEIRPSADLNYKLGKALLAQKSPALAQVHLQNAVKLNPDFAEAYFELAMALADQDRLDEGTKYLQKALSLKPELQQRLNLPPLPEPAKKASGTP